MGEHEENTFTQLKRAGQKDEDLATILDPGNNVPGQHSPGLKHTRQQSTQATSAAS